MWCFTFMRVLTNYFTVENIIYLPYVTCFSVKWSGCCKYIKWLIPVFIIRINLLSIRWFTAITYQCSDFGRFRPIMVNYNCGRPQCLICLYSQFTSIYIMMTHHLDYRNSRCYLNWLKSFFQILQLCFCFCNFNLYVLQYFI